MELGLGVGSERERERQTFEGIVGGCRLDIGEELMLLLQTEGHLEAELFPPDSLQLLGCGPPTP